MILYKNIVEISKNRWIGYMLKVAFLLASSIVFFSIFVVTHNLVIHNPFE